MMDDMGKEGKMKDMNKSEPIEGFEFTLHPNEIKELGLEGYKEGHTCIFMLKADLKAKDEDGWHFQAVEIEKMNDMDMEKIKGEMPQGVGKMYKQAMAPNYDLKKDKSRIQYVKSATEPAAG